MDVDMNDGPAAIGGDEAPTATGVDEARAATGVDDAQKAALVRAELQRTQCLPPSSAYAIHRLKVLNKLLELITKVRSNTEAEELEALFAKMAF